MKAEQPTPPLSFVDFCGFIAVRQAQDSEKIVQRLLIQAFAIDGVREFYRAEDFREALRNRFGLHLPENRIQSALDKLLNNGTLRRAEDKKVMLTQATKARLDGELESVREQESAIKKRWLKIVSHAAPTLPEVLAWSTLTTVLQRLFRRHGLQTLNYLGANFNSAGTEDLGVRALIRDVCKEMSPEEHRVPLEAAITEFFNGAREDTERATYIAGLADSMVSFLSLTVPPEVAERLRTKLQPLDVFIDTDILFGLIGAAEPETTDAAQELAEALTKNQLPVELRFHEETERELRNTFDNISAHLRTRIWSPALSAAVARTPNVNTLVRLYHERNASSALTPDSFLRPYAHVDILIRDKGATPHRETRDIPEQAVYDLIDDYTKFLERNRREKTYEVIRHDVILLMTVRRLRVAALSSLEARALLVTNDVMLHRFEAQVARREKRLPCVLLLRQLLQLLRPFIPATTDFDVSFAETFAAPEFRALDSKSASAMSKLLELLAAYRDINEETASALLTNDLLLGQLQSTADRAELHAIVESALAAENASLQVERDRLAAKLERADSDTSEKINAAVAQVSSSFESERKRIQEEQDATNTAMGQITARLDAVDRQLALKTDELTVAQAAKDEADRKAAETNAEIERLRNELAQRDDAADQRQKHTRLLTAVILTGILVISIELALSRGYLPFVARHNQSYGLRGTLYLAVGCLWTGLLRPDLRKGAWVIGAFPTVLVVFQLLGGPRSTDAEQSRVPAQNPDSTIGDQRRQR